VDNEYFMERVGEMEIDDIDNIFFREVAKAYGVKLAAELLLKYDEVYPETKEGQRKISVPLKSTFIFRANKRKIDGIVSHGTNPVPS